jgi:hypothetical protein
MAKKNCLDREINNYAGKKSENIEWLTIIYNDEEIAKRMIKRKADRVAGDKNPWANHEGKYSPFSMKNKNYSEEKAAEYRQNITYNTTLDYYLKKGMGLCFAIKALKERQAVGRLDKFIERYGEIEGAEKWKNRQEKWLNTLYAKSEEEKARINSLKCSTGYTVSRAEKEIFSKIYQHFGNAYRSLALPYNNGKNYYVYDIVVDNKIIEYNGDLWHANPSLYSESYINPITKKTALEIWQKEENKEKVANEHGYQVYRIWESEYNKDKEGCIQKCISFLTR